MSTLNFSNLKSAASEVFYREIQRRENLRKFFKKSISTARYSLAILPARHELPCMNITSATIARVLDIIKIHNFNHLMNHRLRCFFFKFSLDLGEPDA